MTNFSRLMCSIIAFVYLSLFIWIEYIRADWVLNLYIILTSKLLIHTAIGLVPMMIFLSVINKNFGYSLALIISMTGQTMFVHVYADKYQMEITPQTKKQLEIKYNPYFKPIA